MVARTKAFDTNEILHKAMNVFGNLGYEGTSLPDLITGLGIARHMIRMERSGSCFSRQLGIIWIRRIRS